MSDFTRRGGLGADVSRLQRDLEPSLDRLRNTAVSEAQAYEPGDSSNWADPAPATAAEALDRLADAVAGLLGTPVP